MEIATLTLVALTFLVSLGVAVRTSSWLHIRDRWTYHMDPVLPIYAGREHNFDCRVRVWWPFPHTMHQPAVRLLVDKSGTRIPEGTADLRLDRLDDFPRRVRRGDTITIPVHVRPHRPVEGFLCIEAADDSGRTRRALRPFAITDATL